MSEWFLKEEDYEYKKDKNTFITNNIILLLNVLNKIRLQTENGYSKFNINPLIKLISLLIVIFLNSLTKSFTFILLISTILFVIINFLKIDKMKYILKSSMMIVIFTTIILLPSLLMGYNNSISIITMKVLNSVMSANIFACTTKWNDLFATLKTLHIPDTFIFIIDTTLKYISILGEYSLDMFYALKLKSVGKSSNKMTSISVIIGTTAMISKDRALEMNDAMECRGFTGKYKISYDFKLKFSDYIYIILNVAIIFAYFYLDRM